MEKLKKKKKETKLPKISKEKKEKDNTRPKKERSVGIFHIPSTLRKRKQDTAPSSFETFDLVIEKLINWVILHGK